MKLLDLNFKQFFSHVNVNVHFVVDVPHDIGHGPLDMAQNRKRGFIHVES